MKTFLMIISLGVCLISIPAARATSLLPISLQQLSTRASLIFYGTVINNEVKKDQLSGHIASFTEFEVIDLIKGKTGNTHTIKQIGGHLPGSQTTVHIHGVPEYTVGRRYLVFLPETSKLGFSSPLGLQQGSFDVISVDGEQIVSNGRQQTSRAEPAGRSVTLPLAVNPAAPAQSRLDDFINTVRAYNVP